MDADMSVRELLLCVMYYVSRSRRGSFFAGQKGGSDWVGCVEREVFVGYG